MNIFSNKNLLIFLGGVALGILGSKAVKNEKFRQLCMLGLAKGLQMKDQIGIVLEGLQENAADFLAESQCTRGNSRKNRSSRRRKTCRETTRSSDGGDAQTACEKNCHEIIFRTGENEKNRPRERSLWRFF